MKQKGFVLTAIVLIVALIIVGLGSAYYFGKSQVSQSTITPQPSLAQCKICKNSGDTTCSGNSSCVISEGSIQGICLPVLKIGQSYTISQINNLCGTNFSDNTLTDWKTYKFNDASFKYPATWNVLDTYTFKGDVNREGFTLKCSGPILQDSENNTTLIAVESIKSTQTDGAFCWSIGEFKPGVKRNVTSVNPSKEISIFEWIPGVLVKSVQNKQASLLFQTYNFNEFSKTFPTKDWYQFALIYEKGERNSVEQTFDQILSTFKFTSD